MTTLQITKKGMLKKRVFEDEYELLLTLAKIYKKTEYQLYELPEDQITNELRNLSKAALKKDKKLFSNL